MNFFLILVSIAVCVATVTYFLHMIKVRWVKYIPALLFLVFAILMIFIARSSNGEGMQDLGYIVLFLLLLAGAVGGGIMAGLLDWRNRKRSK